MKVKIDKSRKVYKGNSNNGRINENKYEVLEFVFPEELEDFTKYIEIEATDSEGTLRYADRIEDNEFAIDNTLSKYSLITAQVVCKDLRENVVFKSNPFEFTFEQSLNIMEDIEEEQHDLLDRIELELQEAQEDINDLQEIQEQHTEQIQANATEIEALQGRVSINETDIDNLETEVTNIKTKNAQQDNAINENTQDISDIKVEQTTQNNKIAGNTNRITVLESDSGNKVALSIDSNYVMTLQLLNKSNEVLSTGTIDLPIENMIVNASYSNGILTLTLQNGQTLNVDISDIVSGLVSETTFNQSISRLEGLISGLDTRMTTAETNIANKVDKVAGKGLSTEDFTTAEKNKLANLENYDDTEVNEEIAELNEKITELETDLNMATDLIPTGDATGSDITLSDSARYYFKKIVPGGKSEQETFTGKNILNPNKLITNVTYDNTTNIYTFNLPNKYDHIAIRNTVLRDIEPNTNYKIVFDIMENTADNNIQLQRTDKTIFYGTSKTIVIASGEIGKKVFEVKTREDLENATYDLWLSHVNAITGTLKTKIMIMKATETDDTYEPYVGGQPAPNPDYECPIKNVTGNVEVKVVSQNICTNVEVDQGKNNIIFYADVKLIKQTFNIAFTTNTALQGNSLYCSVDGQNLGLIKAITATANSKVNESITLSNEIYEKIQNATSLNFRIYKTNAGFVLPSDAQISNETITDYVPHEEQTAIFPLEEGQVLHEGDTIEDKIVQKRKTITLTGNETWVGGVYNNVYRYYTTINDISNISSSELSNAICSHFYKDANVLQEGIKIGMFCQRRDTKNVFFATDKTTIEEFKAYLAEQYAKGTPVTLEYELETPLEISFTQAQATAKAQIDKLYSYKGTTHITSEATLDVTYRKDLETMFDKMEELDARLSLLES